MQLIAESHEDTFLAVPARIVGAAMDQGLELFVREPNASAEQGDMDSPLVFGATKRGRSTDDNLPLPQRDVTRIQQTAREELAEQPCVAREGRKQNKWGPAPWHGSVEPPLHIRAKGRCGRQDSCGHDRQLL